MADVQDLTPEQLQQVMSLLGQSGQSSAKSDTKSDPGWGSLWDRRSEKTGNQPDFTGYVVDPNGIELEAAIWFKTSKNGGKYLRLHIQPKYESRDNGPEADPGADEESFGF